MKFSKSNQIEGNFQVEFRSEDGGIAMSFTAIEKTKNGNHSASLFKNGTYKASITIVRPDEFWPMVKEMGIPVVHVTTPQFTHDQNVGDAA